MERIVVPAEPDVPEPGLAPQADDAIHQDEGVEYPPPSCFTKLLQSVWKLCLFSLAQPTLNLYGGHATVFRD